MAKAVISSVMNERDESIAAPRQEEQLMSTTVEPGSLDESLRGRLWAGIAKPLAAVEQRLHAELTSRCAEVDPLVRYSAQFGGKRLRPALLLLAADSLGSIGDDHVVLGTVVEMIHTATLIHDDVIDEADTRRHLATVRARWDNQTSVLLGDFLFSHAFFLASTLGSTVACRWIGQATNRVCEGEMRQKLSRGAWDLGEAEYLEIVEAKTAALCEVSCRLGAHFAGATTEQVNDLAEYGRLLGIAFQIADDLLDVVGEESVVGKSLGTDLEQQKPTLPVLRALAALSPSRRDELRTWLCRPTEQRPTGQRPTGQWPTGQGVTQQAEERSFDARRDLARRREVVRSVIEETGAAESARQTAREHAAAAAEIVERLPVSQSRTILLRLAEFVVDRPH